MIRHPGMLPAIRGLVDLHPLRAVKQYITHAVDESLDYLNPRAYKPLVKDPCDRSHLGAFYQRGHWPPQDQERDKTTAPKTHQLALPIRSHP